MAMKSCKHGTFLYNEHDLFVGRSLDRYGQWCEDELDVLGQIIKPGDVVIDAGANIGTHTVFFSKRVGASGCVLAFEPQRLVFQNLCANLALNALVNVIARQQAVGRRAELMRLPAFDPHQDMNFGAVSMIGHPAGELVQVVRIDDLAPPRCDLIKIDVEGMECDVLEGARESIARHHPALFVETNLVDHSADIIRAIDSLGYDAYWQIGAYYNPGNFFGNPTNVFEDVQPEANLLGVHRSRSIDVTGEKVAGPDDNWRLALERLRDGR